MAEPLALRLRPICVFFLSVSGLDNDIEHRDKILADPNIIARFEDVAALKFCR
jgi:hypothetical protein